MPYHLEGSQLRVVRKYVRQPRNRAALEGARVIVLEHILPTTEEFIKHLLAAGAEVFAVLAKPYSIDHAVLARLEEGGVDIIQHSYATLEETDVLDRILEAALAKSATDGRQILILEVGGYFAEPLTRIDGEAAQLIAGVVEDTTFGHNRYLERAPDIPVPVFSVARSPLKEIEARFVGMDAVAAMEHLFRQIGVSIAGRSALVIGYGMIGSSVARALRAHDLNVAVYDKHDNRNLRAFVDGFFIHKKRELLKTADIIFAATADRALTFTEIEECKDDVILASVGSKDTEFDIATLAEQSVREEVLGEHLIKYVHQNGKNTIVAKRGTAVNFLLPSLPTEILDLVFSEMLICALLLLKRQERYPPGVVYSAPIDSALDAIALDWLRFVNIG